jgi:uncharacterized small protein (DUF1192 family)
MAIVEEENVFGSLVRRPPAAHEIGQPIETLSIAEIDERVLVLQAEIKRLEQARATKEATKRAADSFFKS